MHAITLHQPWATLIERGYKTIETRTHQRFKRLLFERIAIHAGKKFDEEGAEWLAEHGAACGVMDYSRTQLGVVVCTATVFDAGWLSNHTASLNFIESQAMTECRGKFGLWLNDVIRCEPFAATGRQGIWRLTPEEVNQT